MSTSAATTAAMHAPVFVPAAPVQDDTAWSVVAPSPSDSATPTPPASATPAVPSTQAAAAWGKWPTIPTPSVDTSWSDTDTHAAPCAVPFCARRSRQAAGGRTLVSPSTRALRRSKPSSTSSPRAKSRCSGRLLAQLSQASLASPSSQFMLMRHDVPEPQLWCLPSPSDHGPMPFVPFEVYSLIPVEYQWALRMAGIQKGEQSPKGGVYGRFCQYLEQAQKHDKVKAVESPVEEESEWDEE